jgi:hypothetical protein
MMIRANQRCPAQGMCASFWRSASLLHVRTPRCRFLKFALCLHCQHQVTRAVAARWRQAPAEVKQRYLDAADIDKKRFSQEMSAYSAIIRREEEAGGKIVAEASAPLGGTSAPALVYAPAPGADVVAPEAAARPRPPRPHIVSREQHPSMQHPSMVTSSLPRSALPVDRPEPALTRDPSLDVGELFCRACQQYFVNLSTLREHVQGRRHRLVTGQPVGEDPGAPPASIFSEEFIRHNRMREQELRDLRRANAQFEEQNRALGLANAKLRDTLHRLRDDAVRCGQDTLALRAQLAALQDAVVTAFAELPLAGEVPRAETVDAYLCRLVAAVQQAPESPLPRQVRELLTRTLQIANLA